MIHLTRIFSDRGKREHTSPCGSNNFKSHSIRAAILSFRVCIPTECVAFASFRRLEVTFGDLEHIATLLVRFMLANKGDLPFGWAPRVLVQCRVPYIDLWDVFHEMYESQV